MKGSRDGNTLVVEILFGVVCLASCFCLRMSRSSTRLSGEDTRSVVKDEGFWSQRLAPSMDLFHPVTVGELIIVSQPGKTILFPLVAPCFGLICFDGLGNVFVDTSHKMRLSGFIETKDMVKSNVEGYTLELFWPCQEIAQD